MQICRTLAGFSFGRADIVRRAMSKKKSGEMEKEHEAFIYGEKDADGNTVCTGALAAGLSLADAEEIFIALFLLPMDEGLALLDKCNAEAVWIDMEGKIHYSPAFQKLIRT